MLCGAVGARLEMMVPAPALGEQCPWGERPEHRALEGTYWYASQHRPWCIIGVQ